MGIRYYRCEYLTVDERAVEVLLIRTGEVRWYYRPAIIEKRTRIGVPEDGRRDTIRRRDRR